MTAVVNNPLQVRIMEMYKKHRPVIGRCFFWGDGASFSSPIYVQFKPVGRPTRLLAIKYLLKKEFEELVLPRGARGFNKSGRVGYRWRGVG